RLRILQYEPFLEADGIELRRVLVPQRGQANPRRFAPEILAEARRADLVLVQRVLLRWLNVLLRAAGKPIVFDIDDALYLLRPSQIVRTESPATQADRLR